jgi:hypothetical protein
VHPRAQPPENAIQNLPSSPRFTPRTFVGNQGWITDHSKSVRSKRAIFTSCSLQKLNHNP